MTSHHTETAALLARLANLPVELQHQVLLELLSETGPCALALFVPEWGVCAHGADPVNMAYDLQRTDVYVKGDAYTEGTFLAGARHGDDDHLVFRRRRTSGSSSSSSSSSNNDANPHEMCLLTEQLRRHFPYAVTWVLDTLRRTQLHRFAQIWPWAPDDAVGRYMSTGALIFCQNTETNAGGGGGGGGGTDEDMRHLMFNSVAPNPLLQLRVRRNPTTQAGFALRLFVKLGIESGGGGGGGGGLLEVDWASMPRLESVFLDLRTYGAGTPVEEEGIRRGAAGMVAAGCLKLRYLAIAGLRTGNGRYVRPDGWETCDWEADETEVDGGVNWVKVFCGAVREGGRLVFVDRRVVNIEWEMWRMRARTEGILPVTEDMVEGEERYVRHVERMLGNEDR